MGKADKNVVMTTRALQSYNIMN